MLTKGKMINELKKIGIRKGDKDGAVVCLEALQTHQVTALYFKHIVNKESNNEQAEV